MNIDFRQFSKRKILIITSIIFLILLIVATVFSILDRNRREALNPGGTGGGYVPNGFVSLRGTDSSFHLSDSNYLAIKVSLESFLQQKKPNQTEYIVEADKSSLSSAFSPNVYRYVTFDIKDSSDDTTYTVHFFIDYITNQGNTVISSDNSLYRDGITYKNIDLLYRGGIPVYVVDGMIYEFKKVATSSKVVDLKKPTLTVNSDGSRSFTFRATINKQEYDVGGQFYYSLDQGATMSLTNTATKSSKAYTLKSFDSGHDY